MWMRRRLRHVCKLGEQGLLGVLLDIIGPIILLSFN